jgi:acetyl esterase/lipase
MSARCLIITKRSRRTSAPLLFFIHGGGWVNGDKAKPGGLALSRVLLTAIAFVTDAGKSIASSTTVPNRESRISRQRSSN